MSDKIRMEFEAWAGDHYWLREFGPEREADDYCDAEVQTAWEAWQASRAELCVELPPISQPENAGPTWIATCAKENYRYQCRMAIEAIGVRAK
ncbi:hypothetical protein D3C78_1493410 [compost metagenome]